MGHIKTLGVTRVSESPLEQGSMLFNMGIGTGECYDQVG